MVDVNQWVWIQPTLEDIVSIPARQPLNLNKAVK